MYEGTGYDSAAICSHLSTLTIRLVGENVIKHTSVDGDTLSFGIFSDASQTTIESINGTGSLEVRGGDNIESCGIYCSQLTVNSGHITAVGGDGTNGGINSYGIRVISRLNVTGGTINAMGGNGAGCWSRGITFGNSILSGGTIKAVGGDASGTGGGRSFGLTGVTTVTGNAIVEAIGGDAYQYSYGMTTDGGGPIAINGGTVTCIAGEVVTGESCGLFGGNASAGQGLSISDKITSFISSGNDKAIDSDNVTNYLAGTGWSNPDGTEGRTEIAVNTTGAALDFKKVQFPTAPKDQTLTFAKSSLTLKPGEKATNAVAGNKTTPVKYSRKNTDVATVDENTGEVTAKAVGTSVITATAPANAEYAKGEASYTVTVTEEGDHQHTLVKHDRVEATEDKEGNIEYWSCEGCGKYFKDADGKEEIELKDTVIPKKPHEITPSENKAMDVRAETVEGGYEVTYPHQIPFQGKGKLTVESFGDNFSVSQGNVSYKVKKIKVNKKLKRIQVTALENAPKDVEKAVKKATKGKKGLPYTQNPYYVRDTDKVTPKFKKSGAAASVKVAINGKDYKAKKTEYDYNEASKLIIFKGENLAGSWAVK